MSLIGLIVLLIIVGILLWVVNTYLGSIIDAKILKIINVVVIVVVVLWLLSLFFNLGSINSIHVGRIN